MPEALIALARHEVLKLASNDCRKADFSSVLRAD
jgi:hypothetical protein